MKKLFRYLAIFTMVLISAQVCAITASEIYNDGTRAFNQARWQEAEEILARFIATWPDHLLRPQARYFKAIASTRNTTNSINTSLASSSVTWNTELAELEKELPGQDLTELRVAIDIANRHNEQPAWEHLANLKPIELKHYLQRGWCPDASQDPMATLAWSNNWLKKNTSPLDPDLESRIQLIRAKSYWQLVLSPLSLSANSNILKVWGCWPVHSRLEESLNRSFSTGCADVKRQVALLGYHFDFFRDRGLLDSKSANLKNRWYSYLSDRGINLQEAWCPR